jgi:hypothetical protein
MSWRTISAIDCVKCLDNSSSVSRVVSSSRGMDHLHYAHEHGKGLLPSHSLEYPLHANRPASPPGCSGALYIATMKRRYHQ